MNDNYLAACLPESKHVFKEEKKEKNVAARLVKSGYKRGGTGMGSPSKIFW